MPAIPPNDFLKPSRQKRQVKVNIFKSYKTKNILARHISNNDRDFFVEHCKSEQLKHSYFASTVVVWNHLNTETVRAETVESFKQALPQCYLVAFSPVCYAEQALHSSHTDTETCFGRTLILRNLIILSK